MATITPFVKRMRTQGGTIYTFSSALEDIGLNINERNNVVKMSHYALLDIPEIDEPENLEQNKFNVFAIPGAYQSFGYSIKDGRVVVAESFQNYALNLETNLLASADYNPALSTTVSERVFWKWLKETGAIRWSPVDTPEGLFWEEELDTDTSVGYNSVVKCVGTISAGSVRTDTFGSYNETYILVPTSFGQTPVYFKQVDDDNYYHGLKILDGNINILGRETYTKPHPDGLEIKAYYDLPDSSTAVVNSYGAQTMHYYDASDGSGSYQTGWWYTYDASRYNTFDISDQRAYFIDSSNYIDEGIYNIVLEYTGSNNIQFKRSKVDCMSLEFDLDKLEKILDDADPLVSHDNLTFDQLAIEYAEDDHFEFNAILLYYSVYNKTLDKVLATNLLGVLFLEAASGSTQYYGEGGMEITIPAITKLQSGASGFGTSYSFRLNIKSDYMLDDTQAIITDSTNSVQDIENWSDVFDNLNKTLGILNQHTGTINYITEQYLDLSAQQTNILNELTDLQYQVNDIARDITGTENTIAMFAEGDDPLVDSSIYMKNGKLGFFNPNPTYPAQFDVSVKVKDLIIENAVRDTSGNILLGYGSPLQIGSSTGIREVDFYAGKGTPAVRIDTSNNVRFYGNVQFDGSVTGITGGGTGDVTKAYVDGSLAIRDASITELYNFTSDTSRYTSALADGIVTDGTLGGIANGTDVATLKGKTYDELWDMLLFPTTLASITDARDLSFTGLTSAYAEPSASYTPTLTAVYDPGDITNGDGTAGPAVTGNAYHYVFKLPGGTTELSEAYAGNSRAHVYTTSVLVGNVGATYTWSVDVSYNAGSGTYTDNKGVAGTNLDANRVAATISANSGTITSRNKRFWGVSSSASLDSTGILALDSSEFATTYTKSAFTLNPSNEYVYYCYPASISGTPTFWLNSLQISAISNIGPISFTNSYGHAESYNVYRSDTVQTGTGQSWVVS